MASSHRLLTAPGFRARLAEAVAAVEDVSSVELVVLVARRSGTYPEAGWIAGLIALVGVFTVLMFHEAELGDYTLYLAPLAAFVFGFLVPLLLSRARTLLVSRAVIARNVELVARATFQKAGLHVTRDATALLVYVSLLERAVYLVADRGVVGALPAAWLEVARVRFQSSLESRDPADALLQATRGLAADLARHLPRRPDDMNELPDAIDVIF